MNARQKKILDMLRDQALVDIETLLAKTHVSPATIRRDLQSLEESGHIERFHGGAKLSRKNHFELSFERRAQINIKQKTYIADIAASFINSGEAVLLGAGTTTLYIARALAQQSKKVFIVTNNLIVVQEAANFPNLRLSLLGGNLDYANMESIGPTAHENLSTHVVDKVFIGVNALDPRFGALSIYEANAYLYRSMAKIARDVFIVADSSKFEAEASHVAVPIHELNHLITDPKANPRTVAQFCQQGVRVHGLGQSERNVEI
ncbi:MAG: DeoR/GlpR transcriptional regulator [Trueperaceae bacterium]|nr:DeoR/GlpR transcriptional regulator [Trueperaceae bacterium]